MDRFLAGQQVVLVITLQPRSKGTLVIDSSVTSTVSDPTAGNNSTVSTVAIS